MDHRSLPDAAWRKNVHLSNWDPTRWVQARLRPPGSFILVPMPVAPILHVEDDENDVFFMRRACQKAGVLHPLAAVEEGQEAVRYLAGWGPYAEREKFPMPCLVLLDLNLPLKSGFEVLHWIRQQADLAQLPVVVLTSSNQEADIHRAYAEGANAYLVKPPNPAELLILMRGVQKFFLHRG